ncbi:hypothetical protein ACQY1Q_15075 [Tenacibaculum sp. TC6]|uniref:hypothetical protein n=1 Tax=Tenacibaculum sp. TC6 TaxID=3423223 RepID=UPI003D36EA9A
MKKIGIVIFVVSLNLMLFSCTDNDDLTENQPTISKTIKADGDCCGEDGEIIPPPPPPPPTGN